MKSENTRINYMNVKSCNMHAIMYATASNQMSKSKYQNRQNKTKTFNTAS